MKGTVGRNPLVEGDGNVVNLHSDNSSKCFPGDSVVMNPPGDSVVMNPPAKAGDPRDVVQFLGWEDPLEEGMATHSSILAWKTLWTEEPGRLQTMGLPRVRHD